MSDDHCEADKPHGLNMAALKEQPTVDGGKGTDGATGADRREGAQAGEKTSAGEGKDTADKSKAAGKDGSDEADKATDKATDKTDKATDKTDKATDKTSPQDKAAKNADKEKKERLELAKGQVLGRGATGDDVRKLQTMLNKGGAGLETDGDLGPKTQQAIRDFQQKNGLTVDGIVGPQTQRALNGDTSANQPGGTPATDKPGAPGDVKGATAPGAPARPGSGQAAVNDAKRYLGMNSRDVRGVMPKFTAAGGQTKNCADFVSSALENQGLVKGHHVGVNDLEQALLKQGYVRVPRDQAQPGDVWMSPRGGQRHTELVATPGATSLIGSNNDRPGHQVISMNHKRNGYVLQLRR